MARKMEKLKIQFFSDPMRKFGVRELSRRIRIDTKTTMKYLKELTRDGIITRKKEKGKHARYEADRHSRMFYHEKSELMVKKILKSGVIEHLEKELKPKTIVLFGSMATGSYHEKSDVDIFVQAERKRLDLNEYDEKIGHPISLFFEKDPRQLSNGLLSNICGGLVLSGYIDFEP